MTTLSFFAAHTLVGRNRSGFPSDGRSAPPPPLLWHTHPPHDKVGGGHFYHPCSGNDTVWITVSDIPLTDMPPCALVTSRYFRLCGVTSPPRYFAGGILPPRTLLARWRLAVISLALCAAYSERKTEEERRAQSSSVSIQLVFQVWGRIITASQLWRGLFFLVSGALTGVRTDLQIVFFLSR